MPYPSPSTFPSAGVFPGAGTPPTPSAGKVIQLGDLVFTDFDTYRFRSVKLDGWDGSVGSTLALQQRPRGPGGWRSVSPQRTPRTIVLSGIIEADDAASMQQAIDAVVAAAKLTDTLLSVTVNGTTRWAFVSQQADMAITLYPTALVKGFSLQLVAPDPRKFANPLSTTARLPSSVGGLTLPTTVPFTIPATVLSGTCSLKNPGGTTGPVILRIDGPCSAPTITHIGTGAALVFASTLHLGAGEYLEVDMEAQTTLANGQASRNAYVSGRGWFGFEPGLNEVAFAASGFDPAALLTFIGYPAWD